MSLVTKIKLLLGMLILILSTGCAMQPSLTIYTQPLGGYVTEVDTGFTSGIAPTIHYYQPQTLTPDKSGCFLVKGVNVKWVSGAVTTVTPIKLCGSIYGSYNITINRPAGVPGLEQDLQFALQVQSMIAQQQQAEAARQAAMLQMYNSTSNYNPPPRRTNSNLNDTVNCTSTQIGNQVHTRCR